MKPTILLINFQDQQKLRKLKMALLPFKLRIKTIEPQDYSQPIGYLAGVKEISQVQIPSALIPQEQMEKEMLILAGITGNLFDQVLYTLRQKNFRRGEKHDKQKTYEKNSTCCNECRSCYDQHAICSSGI